MSPRRLLGQILKEMEVVSESQIQEALRIQRQKGGAIGRILVQLGYATEEEILLALGAQAGMEVLNLEELQIPQEVINKIPSSMARSYKLIPVKFEKNTLVIAMSNPLNINVLDDLRFSLGCTIKGALSDENMINKAIERYYPPEGAASMDNLMKKMAEDEAVADRGKESVFVTGTQEKDKSYNIDNIQAQAEQAPVKKLLNLILLHAIRDQASDIHLEPFEKELKIRYRVDGVLYEMVPPPLSLALALISRIKIMSNLNIAETRLPQDGRISLTVGGKPIDIRVSTLPTMFGESVVLRILNKETISLDIDNIGLADDDKKLIKNLISLPHGVVIVTGPTGSGKTTTLYSALNYLNDIQWKIITTEDPVEYDLPGIVQCQVQDDIGVTYSACLRSILRQDPDVILVGEIRDVETAQMAIESSLTGHLVLTTLHTNDAPSSISRLLDLGVEPFLITATIEGIVAQRLVRKICPHCKEEITPTDEMLIELNLDRDQIKGKKFYYGKKCARCNNTGYRGRLAIFEMMLMSDKVKQMIMVHGSTEALRNAAREEGMRSLRESGLRAIYEGLTTVEEVVRETLSAELEK
ncbi:MAG: ATPase, T2SS/T4P/T4SS family [Planctomycetota bacterium]|nr:ATPase, T2SS/T4P/T4SS family [Planctomycetota bacterium]MDI6787660.1 ATPase, T2SS/T4P/T4SS family [Planctomycetota bacterium]